MSCVPFPIDHCRVCDPDAGVLCSPTPAGLAPAPVRPAGAGAYRHPAGVALAPTPGAARGVAGHGGRAGGLVLLRRPAPGRRPEDGGKIVTLFAHRSRACACVNTTTFAATQP